MVLQTQNNLSDERTEFYLRDRLTWIRFLGLGLSDPVPDANTIWTFREALTKAGAIERLFDLFDRQLREAGYLAMSGQLVDATIVAAPKQRNAKAEKQAIKEGRIPEEWQARPAKLRQKDRDASPAKVSGPWHRRCWMIRLLTDHGRSSTPRPSRRRMGGSRSTWRSLPSAIRTTSAPTGGTA